MNYNSRYPSPPFPSQSVPAASYQARPNGCEHFTPPAELLNSARQNDDKITPLAAARWVLANRAETVYVSDDFYEWTGKCFQPVEPIRLDKEALSLIGDRANSSFLSSIRRLLSTEAHQPQDFFNSLDPLMIPLENGVLDIRTRTLNPHDPKWRTRILLPVSYDPTADCPRFRQALEQWLPDDPGARELLVEWMGYCLIPDTRMEKALVLVGEGANGKGRFIRILEHIVGARNCAGLPLAALKAERTFPTASLNHKLINVCPEWETSIRLDEGWIKSLISGDTLEVERKGRDPFSMRSIARFIIQTNNPPHLSDKSEGIWRRLLVVRFSRTFSDDQQSHGLDEALYNERSGILNLVLDGLQRLMTRGLFNMTEKMIQERASYKAECNPLSLWIEERLEFVDTSQSVSRQSHWVLAIDAYQDYQMWCKESGHSPYSHTKFSREVRRLGLQKDDPKNSNGTTVNAFMGVRLTQYRTWGLP